MWQELCPATNSAQINNTNDLNIKKHINIPYKNANKNVAVANRKFVKDANKKLYTYIIYTFSIYTNLVR